MWNSVQPTEPHQPGPHTLYLYSSHSHHPREVAITIPTLQWRTLRPGEARERMNVAEGFSQGSRADLLSLDSITVSGSSPPYTVFTKDQGPQPCFPSPHSPGAPPCSTPPLLQLQGGLCRAALACQEGLAGSVCSSHVSKERRGEEGRVERLRCLPAGCRGWEAARATCPAQRGDRSVLTSICPGRW